MKNTKKLALSTALLFLVLTSTIMTNAFALPETTTDLITDGDFDTWLGPWLYTSTADLSVSHSSFGNPEPSIYLFAGIMVSEVQTFELAQDVDVTSGTYSSATFSIDYYASQGAIWDFFWYFELSYGSDTYTSPTFDVDFGLSWRTSTDSSSDLLNFLNNHAGKSVKFRLFATILTDVTNRAIDFDNIKLEASFEEASYIVEIEINPFYVKQDFDGWPRPGAADPYFRFNVMGYDDDLDSSTSIDDDWFRAPESASFLRTLFRGGFDIDIGDDELFMPFAGPTYIPKSQLTLPFRVEIEAWDNDFLGVDDLMLRTTITVNGLPFEQEVENDGVYVSVHARSIQLNPLTRTNPVPNTDDFWYWYEVKADRVRHEYQAGDFDNVPVAILDTGIDPNIQGLQDNILYWRDLVNARATPYDDHGHGTEVASLIVGNTGGVATNVDLIVIKIANSLGAIDVSDAAQAINIAATQGARVISMSFGWTARDLSGGDLQTLRDAIDSAFANDIVLIAASGNEKTSLEIYPAHFDNVISISALMRFDPSLTYDSVGDLALLIPGDDSYLMSADIFTNYGTSHDEPLESIELSAAGAGITDFFGGGTTAGTSFACPIVSAVSALAIGFAQQKYNVQLSPTQVRRILRASSVDLGPLGWDPYYGYGMVDAYEALQKVDEFLSTPNVDVVLLIDRSGSMSGSKINDAKASAKEFVDLMNLDDKVGVVSYAYGPRVDYQLSIISSDAVKTAVKNKINAISAYGMTAMGDGLRASYNQLVNYGDSSHPWAIVLMSNGWHNYGTEHPYNVIPDLKSKKIKVYTIGLGSGADMVLLGKIASDTSGFSRFAPTSSDLLEIYMDIRAAVAQEEVISSISSSVAEGETSETSVGIDSSVTKATFTISWGGSDIDLTLLRPDGMVIDPDVATVDPNIEYIEEARYEMYRVWNPMSGTWIMFIAGVYVPTETEEFSASVTAVTNVVINLATDKDSYTYPQPIRIATSLEDWGTPIIGADVQALITRPDLSQVVTNLFDDGQSIHGDDVANDGIYTNYFKQFTEDGSYTIKAIATGTTLTGEAFSRQAQKTVLVSGVPTDTTPPETTLFIGSPQYVDVAGSTYVTSDTLFTLTAVDNNGAGSGVATTVYRVYNGTYDSGWITYTAPFSLTGLSDGDYDIGFNSTDNAGNMESTNIKPVILDNSPPLLTVETPSEGAALQDGVTFKVSAWDLSAVASVTFSLQCAQGNVISPEFESMPAIPSTDDQWELYFDTTQLPDGFYLFVANGTDVLGNWGTTTVPFSIRNWACLELLPASESNKAGRTMPVKFSLRIVEAVDPAQPFVWNEELTIIIYEEDHPENVLQESTYGDTARDYRINSENELYITNFKTIRKKPKTYIVEIHRKGMLIGSFTFEIVK